MLTHDSQETSHLHIGGKIIRLCPTFEDLCQIENKLSTSILALAKKLSDGLISLEELAVILEHSVEKEARAMDLKAAMLEAGIAHITQKLTALFVHLFKGVEAGGKAAEEAMKGPPAANP